MTVVMKLKTRSQKGFSFWHWTMWSMLSSLWQPIIRQTVGFDLCSSAKALPVAYDQGAAVEQLAPVPLFGGIGDRGAERFPDFIPGTRVWGRRWCLGSGLAHSASQLGRRPRMCGVV